MIEMRAGRFNTPLDLAHWHLQAVQPALCERVLKVEPLYYLDPSGQTKVVTAPASLFFPMFSAFRAHLKKDGDRYAWIDGKSPLSWPKNEFFQDA